MQKEERRPIANAYAALRKRAFSGDTLETQNTSVPPLRLVAIGSEKLPIAGGHRGSLTLRSGGALVVQGEQALQEFRVG